MSKGRVRNAAEICADCSASDPNWTSINRGVLICDECCSVHRSLGRHISQVKSLRRGQWSPTQLAMVQQLAGQGSGANNIWEHSLRDPSQNKHGRRKPTPRDQVHPTKADFIRAKYQFLSFVNKQKDGEVNTIDDLSKQLHSSVRTSNLETCLRLLSKGADPNYFHSVRKGNCPLHVAAQAGQPLQVELLVVYGADPGAVDANGKAPADYARTEGLNDLADRLVECQYELTDRLAFFLCSKKPDHRMGTHFIIPEMADSSLDMSELAKQAKKNCKRFKQLLFQLPNHLFEELAMDVYDEVERRENDSIWLSTQDDTSIVTDRQALPFLPVNPGFSATRNQGRQKLARFNAREFATLIIDILSDAKRRQIGCASPVHTPRDQERNDSILELRTHLKVNSIASDDEPLYDSVASDEDYSSIDTLSIKSMREERKHVAEVMDSPVSTEEFLGMKQRLITSENQVQQLIRINENLRHEISRLHDMVKTLSHDNSILHKERAKNSQPQIPNGLDNNDNPEEPSSPSQARGSRTGARPQSMFEPRDQQRLSQKSQSKEEMIGAQSVASIPVREESSSPNATSSAELASGEVNMQDSLDDPTSHYDNPSTLTMDHRPSNHSSDGSQVLHGSSDSSSIGSGSVLGGAVASICLEDEEPGTIPTPEEVSKKTEKITKKIQELLQSAQDGDHTSFCPCSDKIHAAVLDMATLFPKTLRSESVKCALHLLVTSAKHLQDECRDASQRFLDTDSEFDERLRIQQIIQCAYDIAKAAKQLVTLFQ
ncbi:hypothetical protein ScPMuIL_005874 [Solemya velum]